MCEFLLEKVDGGKGKGWPNPSRDMKNKKRRQAQQEEGEKIKIKINFCCVIPTGALNLYRKVKTGFENRWDDNTRILLHAFFHVFRILLIVSFRICTILIFHSRCGFGLSFFSASGICLRKLRGIFLQTKRRTFTASRWSCGRWSAWTFLSSFIE